MAAASPYFMYFPDNYRWSAAIVNMLGSGTFGNSDIGEIHQIGRRLQGSRTSRRRLSGDDNRISSGPGGFLGEARRPGSGPPPARHGPAGRG